MERLTNLLKVLEKRDPNTPGLAERIERVKKDIATLSSQPAPPMKSAEAKKKKKVLVEIDE